MCDLEEDVEERGDGVETGNIGEWVKAGEEGELINGVGIRGSANAKLSAVVLETSCSLEVIKDI